MEFLVLALIAYEVIHNNLHERKESRRQPIVEAVSKLMDKGMRIKSAVPDPQLTTDYRVIRKWMDDALAWTDETNSVLARNSPRASSAFLLITDADSMERIIFVAGRTIVLTGDVRECYQRLVVQLQNLRRIMEIPAAYF